MSRPAEIPPPLHPDQVALIEASFTRVLRHKAALADLVYERYFALDPQARGLFPPDLTVQRAKVMQALTAIVRSLHSDADLARLAEGLARSHQRFGLTGQQYQHMATAIIGALHDSLGAGLTDETRSSWQAAFDRLLLMVSDAQARLDGAD